MKEEILTIQAVAKLFKVADKTVYTMAQRGELPGFKVGALWKFRRQDLDAWINERITKGARITRLRVKARIAPKAKRRSTGA